MDNDLHAAPRSAHWKWWVCGLLLLATMLNYMDRLTLNLMATQIKKEMQLTNEQYGNVEWAFGVAFACGALIMGWVVDHWSVRWIYPGAVLAWSAAGFATGFAYDLNSLMICRFALGLCEAGNWPCALRTTQHILPQNERTMGNSLLQSGAAVGAVLTPLIVLALVRGPGTWRYPFFVIGAIGSLWVFLWLAWVRREDLPQPGVMRAAQRAESQERRAESQTTPRDEQPPLVQRAESQERRAESQTTPRDEHLPLAQRAESQERRAESQTTPRDEQPPLVQRAESQERRAESQTTPRDDQPSLVQPLSPKAGASGRKAESILAVLFQRRFIVLFVLVIVINWTWHFFRVWLPLFLEESRGYTKETVQQFFIAYYIATDLGALSAGYITLRLTRRGFSVHTSRVLVFLVAALLTMLSVVAAQLPKGPLLLVLLLFIGFGALALYPPYYSFSQELTVRHQGLLVGILGFSTWMVSAAMHPRVGKWLDQTKDYERVMTLAGLMPLAGFFVLLTLWGKGKGAKASHLEH